MNHKLRKIAFLLLFFAVSGRSFAQINSLFSASNAGLPNTSGFCSGRFSGGWNAAYTALDNINYTNPASFSNSGITLIDFGLKAENGTTTLNDTSKSSGGVQLTHFAMLMPLKVGKSGLSFGLYNSSQVNYSINYTGHDSMFGNTQRTVSGNGNLYTGYAGTGFRFGALSLGGSVAVEFGNIKYNTLFAFTDSTTLPANKFINNVSTLKFSYTLGAMYLLTLNKLQKVNLGAYWKSDFANSSSDVYSRKTIVTSGSSSETYSLYDSLYDISAQKYTEFGVGASYTYSNSFTYGLGFQYKDFSHFTDNFTGLPLQKSWSINTGIEYRPSNNKKNTSKKYFNKIVYRAGFNIGKSAYNIPNTLNEFKVMGGVSLPVLARAVSFVTLGLEYQQIGTSSVGHTENYFRFYMQVLFGDRWFVRSKFD